MYFTSLVKFPRGVDPQTSVRRPSIELNKGRANLNTTDSAKEVQSYSPELLPDFSNLEPCLQNIKQEHRESDSVGGNEFDHN